MKKKNQAWWLIKLLNLLGFMHAGYPVMIHATSAAELVNPKAARTHGIWGAIHELGHNQQCSVWEFPPHTTECTCNLWSVYVHEEVLGLNRAKAHENMSLENRKHRAQSYAKGGRNLEHWSVWTALETYMQVNNCARADFCFLFYKIQIV